MLAIRPLTCEDKDGPGGVGSTSRGLTHLSDLGGRGLGVSLPSEEQWRAVPGYEGRFEVSDQGRVRSLPRPKVRQVRLLSPTIDSSGYPTVNLTDRTHRVHVLVLTAFVGPRLAATPYGRHLDDNKTNNALANLAWGSASDNAHDCVRNGGHRGAAKTRCANGHPFDEANTRRIPSRPNSRYCRACQADNRDRRRARQRAEGLRVT